MATSNPQIQKNFKLVIENGLPQATVETLKNVHWVRCCPLCGSVHQVTTMTDGSPYTPLCQTAPDLFKLELIAWRKLYPDVVIYKSVQLVEKAEPQPAT